MKGRQRCLKPRQNRPTTYILQRSESAVMIDARACIILASATLTTACHKTQAPAPPRPAVQVTEVVQKDLPTHREWTRSLDGFVNAEIHPQVPPFDGV